MRITWEGNEYEVVQVYTRADKVHVSVPSKPFAMSYGRDFEYETTVLVLKHLANEQSPGAKE